LNLSKRIKSINSRYNVMSNESKSILVRLKSRIGGILFWSVISAAFIGPGTVTTAANAGVLYKLDLLWVLVFATFACVVLQESSSRITIGSGLTLGQAIAKRFGNDKWKIALGIAIIFGSAAYEAGNLLGSVAGLSLIFKEGMNEKMSVFSLFIVSGLLLWFGNIRFLVKLLGIVVALMGLLFIWLALQSEVDLSGIVTSTFIPRIPVGSSLLLIGLLGTTIVPYNLFLGSGISEGQSIKEMRLGLIPAVMMGGVISIAILIVSTEVSGTMSFEAIYGSISGKLGEIGGAFFGFGLFAAGATSTLTAPLASAIAARSLFAKSGKTWAENSWRYRLVWILVLGFGFIVGILGLQPIPVIILAQAVNGFLLPFLVVLLVLIVNDSSILPRNVLNGLWGNAAMFLILVLTVFIGLNNVEKVIAQTIGMAPDIGVQLIAALVFSVGTMFYALKQRV